MGKGKKKVYKFDGEGNLLAEYSSISEAATSNNTAHSKVSANCNGHIKSTLGFIYSFNDTIEITSKRKLKGTGTPAKCPNCNSELAIVKKNNNKFTLKKK